MRPSAPRWVLTLGLLSWGTTSLGQDRPDPRAVAAEVHAEEGYDDELRFRRPGGDVRAFPQRAGGADGEDTRRYDVGGGDEAISPRIDGRGGEAPAPAPELPRFGGSLLSGTLVSRLLLAVVLVILVALAVGVVFAVRRKRAPPPRPQPEAPPAAPGVPPEEEVEADPDALAAEGRYAEAIAALLARALRAVGWRPARERSRTAREVLSSLPSSDPRRGPLAALVRVAERVRFAGDAATEAAFAEARRWCEALLSEPREGRP